MWRRGGLALAALLLLVLAVLGARAATGVGAGPDPGPAVVVGVDVPQPSVSWPGMPAVQPPDTEQESSSDRTPLLVVAVLALLGLAMLVGSVLWRFLRAVLARQPAVRAGAHVLRRFLDALLAHPSAVRAAASSTPIAVATPEIDVAAAVRAAERELREQADGSPADAIIAAWLALEDAAAGAGVLRAPHQTPTEFTMDVLAASKVDAAALAELRRCYQRARFGTVPATERDVATAMAALRRIEQDLPRWTPA